MGRRIGVGGACETCLPRGPHSGPAHPVRQSSWTSCTCSNGCRVCSRSPARRPHARRPSVDVLSRQSAPGRGAPPAVLPHPVRAGPLRSRARSTGSSLARSGGVPNTNSTGSPALDFYWSLIGVRLEQGREGRIWGLVHSGPRLAMARAMSRGGPG